MVETRKTDRSRPLRSLMVRLDEESKNVLVQAAELRGISVSDYVRQVTVAQGARKLWPPPSRRSR